MYRELKNKICQGKKLVAFTLAEVLIVLSILGLVAAIIIPSTINNYEKGQILVKLKIAYSILSKVMDSSQAENGNIEVWNFPPEDNWGSHTKVKRFAQQYITPYLDIVYDCEHGEKCFAGKDNQWFSAFFRRN